jgi:hypothetical protein
MKFCFWCDEVYGSCRWLFSFVPEQSSTVIWPLPNGVPSFRTYFKGWKGFIIAIAFFNSATLILPSLFSSMARNAVCN